MSEGAGWKPGHFIKKGLNKMNSESSGTGSGSSGGERSAAEQAEPAFTVVPVQPSDADAFPPAPANADSQELRSGSSLSQSEMPIFPTESESIFINVVVVDSSAAVSAQVKEKLGSGFWGKSAAAMAKSVVTESKIASKVAAQLAEKIPAAVESMGITLDVQPKFQHGAYVVLRAEVQEVTPVQLVRFAKGDRFAASFSAMVDAFKDLELRDALDQVSLKVQGKVYDALVEKLAEVLPAKLQEQGITTTVVAKNARDQAEFFFDFIQSIQGTPGAKDP